MATCVLDLDGPEAHSASDVEELGFQPGELGLEPFARLLGIMVSRGSHAFDGLADDAVKRLRGQELGLDGLEQHLVRVVHTGGDAAA